MAKEQEERQSIEDLNRVKRTTTYTSLERFLHSPELFLAPKQRSVLDSIFAASDWQRISPDNRENLKYQPTSDKMPSPTLTVAVSAKEQKARLLYHACIQFGARQLVDVLSATPQYEEWILRPSSGRSTAGIVVKIENPATDMGKVTEIEFVRHLPPLEIINRLKGRR